MAIHNRTDKPANTGEWLGAMLRQKTADCPLSQDQFNQVAACMATLAATLLTSFAGLPPRQAEESATTLVPGLVRGWSRPEIHAE